MTDEQDKAVPHCGFVAVIGAPNAGKSTLVNALVGQKVSIVTHKAQTTRFQIRGVAVRGPSQIVLVDTPGVFAPKRRLDRAMVRAAWDGVSDADAVLHVVDAAASVKRGASSEEAELVAEGLAKIRAPAILALNKIDLVAREALLALIASLTQKSAYEEVFMISALTGDGVEDLAAALAARMPEGPWHYPEDQVADLSTRLLAAEVTREKVFLRLHDEIPYAATVETEMWTEREDGSARVDQIIYVSRDSHKRIAVGEGGRTIKAIGQAAREELEKTLGRRIHLFLHVKVVENWMDDSRRFAELGLDFKA